jgi:hypothetical protein
MKRAIILALFSTSAMAQYGNGFVIPVSPSNYGQDRVVVNGFECSTAVGTQKHFEMGAVGQQSAVPNQGIQGTTPYTNYQPQSTGGIYARVIIPLDAPKHRPECNRLFELELAKRELELEMYKKNMAAPKDSEFKR